MFPPNYEEMVYVEPFVGSGAVFFGKNKSKKEVLNDIDKILISHYKLIKSVNPEEASKYKRLTTLESLNNFVKQTGGSASDKVARYIVKSCNTFSQSGRGKIYKNYTPFAKLNRIQKYKDRMSGVVLTSQDYKQVIRKYDNPNTLFYLDPPYQKSDRLYKDENMDYEELANLLKTVKGKFILSLNDSPSIRNLFSSFKIKGFTVKAKNPANDNIGSKDRKEVLITNY